VLDPAFAPLFRDPPADGATLQALAHPMLLALIENALVPDPAFETFLRTLRQRLLAAWCGGALAAAARAIDLACALAQQCFLNEYVWPESAAEIGGCRAARRRGARRAGRALRWRCSARTGRSRSGSPARRRRRVA
jgi:hypothetical protein